VFKKLNGNPCFPLFQENPQGNSIMESRQGNNTYTLLIALLSHDTSSGFLYNENGSELPDLISFESTNSGLDLQEISLMVTVTRGSPIDCDSHRGTITVVEQIKFLGFPASHKHISISVPNASFLLGDDVDTLRIYGLQLNWCDDPATNYQKTVTIIASEP
jgi:hypothetical protein